MITKCYAFYAILIMYKRHFALTLLSKWYNLFSMKQIIVNEELVNEFVRQSQDPIIELQFKGGISRGTAFYFLRNLKVPKREKTMKKIANGIGADFNDLFRSSSQAAS